MVPQPATFRAGGQRYRPAFAARGRRAIPHAGRDFGRADGTTYLGPDRPSWTLPTSRGFPGGRGPYDLADGLDHLNSMSNRTRPPPRIATKIHSAKGVAEDQTGHGHAMAAALACPGFLQGGVAGDDGDQARDAEHAPAAEHPDDPEHQGRGGIAGRRSRIRRLLLRIGAARRCGVPGRRLPGDRLPGERLLIGRLLVGRIGPVGGGLAGFRQGHGCVVCGGWPAIVEVRHAI
jgi:hypothetical protein